MRTLKTKRELKKELNSLINEYWNINARVKKMNIDIKRYCNDSIYRAKTNRKIKNYERALEATRKHWVWYYKKNRDILIEKCRKRRNENRQYIKDYTLRYNTENREMLREKHRKFREEHPWITRRHFEKRTLDNPNRAMLCAASNRIASAAIRRLWIRPTVCPHCGRSNCNIDFHHPNHLFWWKWTFCCKSCHYFFNRDKVPAADKIIDLKKLLRESISH